MAYARIAKVRLAPHWGGEALGLMRQLMALCMTDERCLFQGTSSIDSDGEIVRVSLWETRKAADDAAGRPQSLAIRSQLLAFCETPPREEGYELTGAFRTRAVGKDTGRQTPRVANRDRNADRRAAGGNGPD